MFGIGMQELIIILVILVIIFGVKKLPEIGKALGKGIKEFKKAGKDITGDGEQEDKDKDKDKPESEKKEN